ncbi:hypothetical protein J6590_086962, partial [Homalodisca vitripennis]
MFDVFRDARAITFLLSVQFDIAEGFVRSAQEDLLNEEVIDQAVHLYGITDKYTTDAIIDLIPHLMTLNRIDATTKAKKIVGDYDIFMYSKPGAKLKEIISEGKPFVKDLCKDDFVILLTDTNNISDHDPSQLSIIRGLKNLNLTSSSQQIHFPSGAHNPLDGITARLNSMYLSEVSVSEVETAVRQLRSTNAAGV